MDLKVKLFGEIDDVVKKDAISPPTHHRFR